MTTEQAVQYLNIQANADLSSGDLTNAGVLHKAVTLNGVIALAPALFAGLLKSKGKTGEGVRIAYAGVAKGWAGAAISTVGYPVTVTASGFLIAASSGAGCIGRAFSAAASGDVFPVMLDGGLGFYAGA